MIFLDFCFFSNSIRYFLGHPIDCWLYWWVLPRYMYISSNDKVVRAKKGTGGLHLVKTVKTWSPSSFLFLLLLQNILTAIITMNSNPGASDHHRLVRRARHRWAVRRRHGKARRLSRLSWILNISFAHFCQFLMFSFWTFFTNMSILDPLVIPVQYKFYNWQFLD